jgi:hypothetical protein
MTKISGNGCLVLVTDIQPDGTIRGDFLSSVFFATNYLEAASHFQAEPTTAEVVMQCNREQWYQLKTSGAKQKFAMYLRVNLTRFALCMVAGILIDSMVAVGFVLEAKRRNLDMYLTLILIPAVFFMVGWLIVVPCVINNFLLQNCFDSFLHEEQEQ